MTVLQDIFEMGVGSPTSALETCAKGERERYSMGERDLTRGLERVAQDEDDGVAAEEHLGDEAVAVHRLGLLLPWNGGMTTRKESAIGQNFTRTDRKVGTHL